MLMIFQSTADCHRFISSVGRHYCTVPGRPISTKDLPLATDVMVDGGDLYPRFRLMSGHSAASVLRTTVASEDDAAINIPWDHSCWNNYNSADAENRSRAPVAVSAVGLAWTRSAMYFSGYVPIKYGECSGRAYSCALARSFVGF